ncbi:hypothetical protein QTP88_011388 [Uroleucon formosanum]
MWVPYHFIKLKRSRENAHFAAYLSTKPCQYRCVVQPGVELGRGSLRRCVLKLLHKPVVMMGHGMIKSRRSVRAHADCNNKTVLYLCGSRNTMKHGRVKGRVCGVYLYCRGRSSSSKE